MGIVDESSSLAEELAQLARLSMGGSKEEVRLYVARLVRRHRISDPDLSNALNKLLKDRPDSMRSVLREQPDSIREVVLRSKNATDVPSFLIGPITGFEAVDLFLSSELESQIFAVIQEYRNRAKLAEVGLRPTASMIFVGKPGVGKTLSARWLAYHLDLPLYILDLASVIGSYLGQTGANLKSALTFARENTCVLLLDEIDALAKRRTDESDIGEIKRIVTVMLQEIERWPSHSLLIAATNHPELVDPALWRRFDHVLHFDLPSAELAAKASQVFFGPDYYLFESYMPILAKLVLGQSFSDIERLILRIRRAYIITGNSPNEIVASILQGSNIDKKDRLEIAKSLLTLKDWSQHRINQVTGISRDTLRKYGTPQD